MFDPATPSSPETPAELTEALGEYDRIRSEEPTAGHSPFGGFKNWDEFDKAHHEWDAKVTAARSALVALYTRQREELESQVEQAERFVSNVEAAYAEENRSLLAQLDRQREEIERLRSAK